MAEVCVFGLPHAHWGEVVTAVVTFRPGRSATRDELIDSAKGDLAEFQALKKILIWESMPQNTHAKMLRKDLVTRYSQ